MSDNNFILNLKKSPDDSRDILFTIDSNYPEILDYRSLLMPIRNQGSQGTCYAQSACCMKEWQEKNDYGLKEYLSPQFFYNNRFNKYDEDQNNDDGMFGRDVMKLLSNVGVCLEKNYEYGRIEDRESIPENIYNEAKLHCIRSYARVTTLEQLKKSLWMNGPCLIAFPVYNYGLKMWKQDENQEFSGGHAMTVVGYDDDGFIIRNSWGENWGDNGYCIYPYSEWGSHWEIWTTVDLDTEIQKPEPVIEPDDKPYIDPIRPIEPLLPTDEETYTCPCTIL